MVARFGIKHHSPTQIHEASDPAALAEAVEEAVAMINHARHPVILADVEVHRFGLQELLLLLIEKANIPFASTILGKSVMSEQHPLCLGVYEGAMGATMSKLSSRRLRDHVNFHDRHQSRHHTARSTGAIDRAPAKAIDPLSRSGIASELHASSPPI
jgi:TPP-dependent 2-oxoacid decarboxylase